MTTQVPPGPEAAAPPQPAYPTTPPWVTPPAAPAGPPPYAPYGQLIVPFPEEMHNAARPQPPSWWPVVVWTFFFGILGAVAASRRADRARRGRNSVAPYWVAWAVTVAVWGVLCLVGIAVGKPAYESWRETVVTKAVASNLVHDGKLAETARVTATKAACDPVGPRDPAGDRRYDCTLTLNDGRTASLTVTADSDGAWTAVPVKK